MHLPSERPRQQIVIAADVSASVFDLATQNSRVHEILKGLDPQNVEVAVTVFGATAGSERLMGPLVAPDAPPNDRERDALRRRPHSASNGLPDLSRLTTVVDRSATDIGNAINFSRGQFTAERDNAARAVLVLSDFRNTRGNAEAAAASLSGSGVDLLTTPVLLGPSSDVHISALRVPETAQLGRALPIEVTVASQMPCTVRVKVWRKKSGGEDAVGFKTVELAADPSNAGGELRRVVRILDTPDAPGVAVYTAHVSGTEGELSGDINSNNQLSAATRIVGPSRWAVLTRAGSTLDLLARNPSKPLGTETVVFDTQHLPQNASAYDAVGGVLVDGLSAEELGDGAALAALTQAVDGGKALLAVGGEHAFGAGGHPHDGNWEKLLPCDMTPEDDRTRSVLFLIDVSKSMDEKMGRSGAGVRKIDFANEQLAQAVQKLKPLDRLGLITFSGSAQIAAQLSGEPSRVEFLSGVKKISIQANTDILPAIKTAAEVLKNDDAEEQLVVLLSDGVQTAATPVVDIVAAAKQLCPLPREDGGPRRTTLFTFGIGVDPQDNSASGEALLKDLASAGGGAYSPDFLKLAERLERAFESQKKDFFVRREPFALRPAYEHPVLGPSGGNWPALPFRNRVRAKPSAEALLWSSPAGVAPVDANASRRPDPLLILSGSLWPGASRRGVLALSLDGPAGAALLGSESGRRLLPSLLEWMEAKKGTQLDGWSVQAEPADDDSLGIDVRANDPVTGLPINGRKLSVTLTALQLDAADAQYSPLPHTPLHPSAPGVYRTIIPALPQGIYRLSVHSENQVLCERFVSVPYPAELRRFGADRAAMQQLVAKAGAPSRVIDSARDLSQWADEKAAARDTTPLAPYLVVAAIGLLLAEFAKRRS